MGPVPKIIIHNRIYTSDEDLNCYSCSGGSVGHCQSEKSLQPCLGGDMVVYLYCLITVTQMFTLFG